MMKPTLAICLAALGIAVLGGHSNTIRAAGPDPSTAFRKDHGSAPPTLQKTGHPLFCSPHATPIAIHGDRVFVVNTPADTVDVLDRQSMRIVGRIPVGIDPVSIAIRPDGKEIWVANHVSDSVSVIDNDANRPTCHSVIATLQSFDPKTRATQFDEPVGIAFADNEKAYVALSSENEIAVVSVANRSITKRLQIPAQDPRAIVVRNERLYVIPFESNNQTQLSGGRGDQIDGDLVTFDAWQHSILHNNVLSIGHVVDVIKHPMVPDRDLFVYDTTTDELVSVVDTLGTLLYGMTVDSTGNVYIAQTDARNDANGRAGTKKHDLRQLENRAFLNRITRVNPAADTAASVRFIDLEPLPPKHPAPNDALATPFAIQVTADDQTLVATAAGSDKLFTVDVDSGRVLGSVTVGSVPRGIAMEEPGKSSENTRAWVYNAVGDSVTIVDLNDRSQPTVVDTIALQDPTSDVIKRGRMHFNSAAASTTGTYSCASCHPDGHTDQLLWVLKTPIVSGGNQIMPRSTMPLRGLRDTAPFHWDGVPGDPYGGNNSASVWASIEPNSDADDPESLMLHLIDGGLAATMRRVDGDETNDEGKDGAFTAEQRREMAKFLLSIPFPPAQKRAYTNVVSRRATRGFDLFHIRGHLDDKAKPNVCGDCHRMPFLVSTNTPGTGMDAPTWRGAYDRFLILPQGRLNIVEFDFYRRVAQQGIPERSVWQFSWQGRPRFDPIWDMVLEGSTGFSGTLARQVTLSKTTADQLQTLDLLDALETAADEQSVVLNVHGVFVADGLSRTVTMQFIAGRYVHSHQESEFATRDDLIQMAMDGEFIGTFTAHHGENADAMDNPQPALWTRGPIQSQRGHQQFPILHPGNTEMAISGRHIVAGARAIVDGRVVPASVLVAGNDNLDIRLETLPEPGLHLLQVQNPGGRFSNDFLFNVTASKAEATALVEQRRQQDRDIRDAIAAAIADNDAGTLQTLLNRPQQSGRINERRPASGSTPLSTAALHGKSDLVRLLLRRGAAVEGTNRDGNTALHVAAFLCRKEIVEILLEKNADVDQKNQRGQTPLDVVSAGWNDDLANVYRSIATLANIEIDLESMKSDRSEMKRLLSSPTD